MTRKKRMLHVFTAAFFTALILFSFFICFLWVDIKADRSGFEGFFSSMELSRTSPLAFRITAASHGADIDLSALNSAAEIFQRAEVWLTPRGVRLTARISFFIGSRINERRSHRLEQEFYKNAGLV